MCMNVIPVLCAIFVFNVTATPKIYPLSLHDALPISARRGSSRRGSSRRGSARGSTRRGSSRRGSGSARCGSCRSEEHTSELQSQSNLVCRLLLEKKKPVLTQLLHTLH